jgi:uncharacterized membrane protein
MNWHREHKARMRFGDRMAEWMSRRIGSTFSIFLHTAAFIACGDAVLSGWVSLNTMLLALTTVVSLEAIYLCLFLQNSSNRHSDLAEHQARQDFEWNILAASKDDEYIELAKQMVEKMGGLVGIQEAILKMLVEPEIKARRLPLKRKN